MNRSLLNDTLSGGYISRYDFDMGKNLFVLQVDVLENGVLSTHEVRFEKVSRFLFETESPFEGDRLEVTEIWIDAAPEGSSSEEWSIIISIWDLTHLRVRCTSIDVNGDRLI